jgi:hypothetical protein
MSRRIKAEPHMYVALPREGDIGGPRVTARRVCADRLALTDEPPEPTQLYFWQTK